MIPLIGFGQVGQIQGLILHDGKPLPYAQVYLDHTKYGQPCDSLGHFRFENIPFGEYQLVARFIGYTTEYRAVSLDSIRNEATISIDLAQNLSLDEIVITGTKTFKRKTDSPVIVGIISSDKLDGIQACNLSEGLKFQPGLRVETDCQTCNYTQLRMNGLAGGYAQILINGRPIFSPLTALYGLEQLPVNMIERIEVVRGGGSSLYGSSAIGGTVNVISRIPKDNSIEINYNYQTIQGQSSDHQIFGNGTRVSVDEQAGISFFVNHRNRGFYDHNQDNYSEIPQIKNTSVGMNAFVLPHKDQKLELSLSRLEEYRLGGEMLNKDAHLLAQAEERDQEVWMGNLDYQINFNQDNSSLITYAAWQQTNRSHFTGIFPDQDKELEHYLQSPPYGQSAATSLNIGLQLNHRMDTFLKGENVLTFGSEYLYDRVLDEISAYRYSINQKTQNVGVFIQSDWKIISQMSLLSGIRMDWHSLIAQPIFNPRISLLYKYKKYTQLRLNYGTGFRAPQAFDADLHIAFAGGGVSRIQLAPELTAERSRSLSASLNYDRPTEHFIAGFTIEGFYTRLNQAFVLNPVGQDDFGLLFEKQNGQGAQVQGVSVELRANYDRKIQLETGFTFQSSRYDRPVTYLKDVPGMKAFVRTPNQYGSAILSFTPNNSINLNCNYIYTGPMFVPHFGGAPNHLNDEMVLSTPFHEVGIKMGYNIDLVNSLTIEWFGGIKNLFNAYQDDFDIGKNRDSNYIYGPAQPRTFYIGLKLRS